jgi:hypothetical protein
MTLNEILAIADFLGEGMTDGQAERLMDEARNLSIGDREVLYQALHHYCVVSPKFYTELSINRAESRWEAL